MMTVFNLEWRRLLSGRRCDLVWFQFELYCKISYELLSLWLNFKTWWLIHFETSKMWLKVREITENYRIETIYEPLHVTHGLYQNPKVLKMPRNWWK